MRNSIITTALFIFLIGSNIFVSCKRQDPQERLTGEAGRTWASDDDDMGKVAFRFFPDKTFSMTNGQESYEGTFVFTPETNDLVLSFNNQEVPDKTYQVLEVDNDHLILEVGGGQQVELRLQEKDV